jgi:thiamine biosynthesis lipoprotein
MILVVKQPYPGRRIRSAGLFLFPALLIVLALAACSRPADPIVLNGLTMGTTWTVQLGQPPSDQPVAALRREIEALLEQVNDEMSTWREDSDLSRFNRLEPGQSQVLPEGFARVLEMALDLAGQTGGAFDPTVGPLVNLWGFGPDGRVREAPDQSALQAARERVGYWRLEYDPVRRELTQPGGVYLDLSGIAKGWGVDVVAEHLLAAGIDDFLVDIGGDMRLSGTRPDGQAWRIAIERPVPGTRDIYQVIQPGSVAMVTSGTYRQFFEADGRRFSHTIDPRTGEPVQHPAISITVIGDNATWIDGLATALGVLDPDEAYEFAVERNLAVLWILQVNGELEERYTPAFAPLIEN